jgi:hypothetical protein
MTKLLKEIEEAMIWAYENNKMELFSVLQGFFDLTEEAFEPESEEDSEEESDMEDEKIAVVTDEKGFLSLA